MNFYKRNKGTIITIIVLCIIAITGKFLQKDGPDVAVTEDPLAATTEVVKPVTHSSGTLTFEVPEDFRLALSQDQILVSAYIPPCDGSFEYCLYYDGLDHVGTNFESAGIRIKKRTDLKTVATCLNSSPENYAGLKSTVVASTSSYIISAFPGIGDAGAGHYASGELFRLSYDGTCHEFETRVGATQFANFAEGTIKEFAASDSKQMMSDLKDIIQTMTLKNGERMAF